MTKELYDSIEPGYYHHVLTKGKPIQKFWHKHRFLKVLNRMKDIEGKSILDIGCAAGTFLSVIPQTYDQCIGLDIAFGQIEFAKKAFSYYKKINWMVGKTPFLPFKEKSFDYVVMNEVIEHLDLIPTLLQEIRRILKKDGKLILTTPNYHSLWPIIEFFWVLFNPLDYYQQHISKFTPKKLGRALKRTGFRNIKISTFFVLSPFISLISHSLGKRIMKAEESIFPGIGALIIGEARK